jgi:hypothetical protein
MNIVYISYFYFICLIVWYLDLHLPVQSEPIITKVVSSNPAQSKVYSIQQYVIKIVRGMGQVCDFLQFPPPIKLATPHKYRDKIL